MYLLRVELLMNCQFYTNFRFLIPCWHWIIQRWRSAAALFPYRIPILIILYLRITRRDNYTPGTQLASRNHCHSCAWGQSHCPGRMTADKRDLIYFYNAKHGETTTAAGRDILSLRNKMLIPKKAWLFFSIEYDLSGNKMKAKWRAEESRKEKKRNPQRSLKSCCRVNKARHNIMLALFCPGRRPVSSEQYRKIR